MIVSFHEKSGEIELAGSAKEINFLSRQLFDGALVELENDNLESSSDARYLESIRVKHYPDSPVKISAEENYLLIEGSPEKLKILSENLETDFDLKNYHIHIEYFEDHFYLSKDSKPLIISFQ